MTKVCSSDPVCVRESVAMAPWSYKANSAPIRSYSGRIGRAAGVYPDSAQLLHYRVHQRVKSVTTYITAVAERHTPLPWWSAIFTPHRAKPNSGGWVPRYEKRQKGLCAGSNVCFSTVCLFVQACFSYRHRDTCVPSTVWSDYLWSQLYSSATPCNNS